MDLAQFRQLYANQMGNIEYVRSSVSSLGGID